MAGVPGGLLRRGLRRGGLRGWRGLLRRRLRRRAAFFAGAFFAGRLLGGCLLGRAPSWPARPSSRGLLAGAAFFAGAFLAGRLLRPARPSWRAPSSRAAFFAGAFFAGAFLAGAFLAGPPSSAGAAFFAGAFAAGAAFFRGGLGAADLRPITRFAAAAAEPARDLRVVPAMSEGLRMHRVWREPHGRTEGIRCYGAGQPRLAEMRERPPSWVTVLVSSVVRVVRGLSPRRHPGPSAGAWVRDRCPPEPGCRCPWTTPPAAG